MIYVAWRMLVGDRVKYVSLVLGLAFAIMLITQQGSIFIGIMRRTYSMLTDMGAVRVWVMDADVQTPDDVKPLKDPDLLRVRSVPGIAWAVPLFKGQGRARTRHGEFQNTMVLGLDSASLMGGPSEMLEGRITDLYRQDAVIVDAPGALRLGGLKIGDVLELNDRRAEVVGICRTERNFQSLPVVYTTYSRAQGFVPAERHMLSFILTAPQPGVSDTELARRIRANTGLGALPTDEFGWRTVRWYTRNTGIAINFGTTVLLGFFVGLAIAAQTFYTFTHENLRHFAALKAMGAGDGKLVTMVLFQAVVSGLMGYGIGVGVATLFGRSAPRGGPLAWHTPPELLYGAFGLMLVLVSIASVISLRKVLTLEPGIVFK